MQWFYASWLLASGCTASEESIPPSRGFGPVPTHGPWTYKWGSERMTEK